MKIIVATCDKYDHMLPGFAYLFNRFWPDGVNQSVTVIGFRDIPNLPANFNVEILAEKETMPWTDELRPYFEALKENYFTLLLDDYWMSQPVNGEQLDRLELFMRRLDADKADLTTDIAGRDHTWDKKHNVIVADQNTKYRSSLQPAIWRKGYFLTLMKPGRHIWDFERIGQREAANDGARIIAADPPVIPEYANVYKKGGARIRHLLRIPQAELIHMRATGLLNGSFEDRHLDRAFKDFE